MPNQVELGSHFATLFSTLSDEEQGLIEDFIFHFQANGIRSFKGKKGPSDNVPQTDPDRASKIAYARKHQLWHVHIGYPRWNASRSPMAGYETSNYVVHFQKFNEHHIALVDYGSHSPMGLPQRNFLFRQR
jgi:hypothetical protein